MTHSLGLGFQLQHLMWMAGQELSWEAQPPLAHLLSPLVLDVSLVCLKKFFKCTFVIKEFFFFKLKNNQLSSDNHCSHGVYLRPFFYICMCQWGRGTIRIFRFLYPTFKKYSIVSLLPFDYSAVGLLNSALVGRLPCVISMCYTLAISHGWIVR